MCLLTVFKEMYYVFLIPHVVIISWCISLIYSHMGHGSEHPLTVYAHLMFAFYGVVFNDILFSGHSQRKSIHILQLISFLYTGWGVKEAFDMHTRCYLEAKARLQRDIAAHHIFNFSKAGYEQSKHLDWMFNLLNGRGFHILFCAIFLLENMIFPLTHWDFLFE